MSKRVSVIICLVLASITIIAFYRVTGHQFLTYDDGEYVTNNPFVNKGLSVSGVVWAFTKFYAANWHPLTWISHMLDCSIFGASPTGPHVVNVCFHIANAILLFVLLARMTGAVWKSTFVAALFAVHPIHIESVAWVAERKDVLSTFFWLLTTLAYVSYVRHKKEVFARKAWHYGAVVLLFALGLMSKPMLVTLPFVLLLLDFWPLGRWNRNATQGLVLEKAPLFLMSLLSSVMTYLAQRSEAVSTLERIPIGARLSNALVSYVVYIGKMLWPRNLAAIYPHPGNSLPVYQAFLAGAVVLGFTLLVIRTRQTHPYLLTGWFWYLGTLVPVIGVIQVGAQAMADRYTYVPLIGLFVAIAWGIPRLLGISAPVEKRGNVNSARNVSSNLPITFSACVVLLALTVCTCVQVGYWHDTATLFRRALSVTRRNYLAHDFLGATLAISGKYDEAIRHLQASIQIRPNYAAAYSDIGFSLAQQGRYAEASARFEKALELEPTLAPAHYNLGLCFAKMGRFSEAIQHFEAALKIKPDMQAAREALKTLKDFLASGGTTSKFPESAVEHYRRGTQFHVRGQIDEAIKEYREAIRLQPGLAQAHSNLGLAYRDKGDLDAAIREYQTALKLNPNLGEAHANLAIVLYLKGQYPEAWKHVKLCRRCGVSPHPDFEKALSQKMPEPQ